MNVHENLLQVRERIAAAALRAGRPLGEIKLVAVTKNMPVEVINEVLFCGITSLGENRVQEFLQKYPQISQEHEWHFIGHLQTNKVKKIIGKVSLIHSLDRWSLAEAVSRASGMANTVTKVLVQVNVAGEKTKHGLSPAETPEFVHEVADLPGLDVRGLMTIAPRCENPEEVRPVFRQLRELARQIKEKASRARMDYLSMGMTGDFEVAVEEGANILRIGSAIFK